MTGIGGVFFRARDPEMPALSSQEHLGVRRTGATYEEGSWWQDAGPTVFAPFTDTGYFDRPRQAWMIDFRASLDAMAALLRAPGIEVMVHYEVFPNGRFARLHDPEGNPIELWAPAGTDLERPQGL